MSGACLGPRRVPRASRSARTHRVAPRALPGMDMKFAVYFNFIIVCSKFYQEFLNVEQLGRPRPFPFLRDFRLQGVRSYFGRVFRS